MARHPSAALTKRAFVPAREGQAQDNNARRKKSKPLRILLLCLWAAMAGCAYDPSAVVIPPAECPRPAAPEFPAMPQGVLLGSAEAAEWLMICFDEATDYARALDAALACYEAQREHGEGNGSVQRDH